ncbi:hypothetical protein RZS08_34110, partial [Arthrospira platensis SPKY1]|nr:hypothetical protein [Arthrospira platensis SPKY1]
MHAEVDFVLGLSDEQEVSLDGIDLRLRMPKEPIHDQTAYEEIKSSPQQARIVLRSEPLRLGGHYGIDQASQTNE